MRARKQVGWREVNAALGHGGRARAMGVYRERGGTLGSLDVDAMAHALTAAEDELELARGPVAAAARVAVREVRRACEVAGTG